MSPPFLREHLAEGVLTITLDRPEERNAIRPALLAELAETLGCAAHDPAVRAIVLAGAGPVFSAGGDLRLLRDGLATRDEAAERAALALGLEPVRRLLAMAKPTISLLHGAAAGGGLALALACDMRLAATDARFAFAYARIGLAGDLGATWLLAHILGPVRARVFALQPIIAAEEALRIGLVDRLVAPDLLAAEGHAAARDLAALPPLALAAIKTNIAHAATVPFEEACALESESFIALRGSADHREAIDAFLEKRPPSFTGADQSPRNVTVSSTGARSATRRLAGSSGSR